MEKIGLLLTSVNDRLPKQNEGVQTLLVVSSIFYVAFILRFGSVASTQYSPSHRCDVVQWIGNELRLLNQFWSGQHVFSSVMLPPILLDCNYVVFAE